MSVDLLPKGLIVSCQAEEGDPFYGAEYVSLFARAAEMGGAVGIRAREAENVRAIRQAVALRLIGLTKSAFPDGRVLITPDFADVAALLEAGADMVAVDATHRRRPNGLPGADFVAALRRQFPHARILADIATIEEGLAAQEAGAHAVATTLSGYTPDTEGRGSDGPDWALLEQLARVAQVPVIMEGRVASPQQARHALDLGAHAVVVGTAITRPRLIVANYVSALR